MLGIPSRCIGLFAMLLTLVTSVFAATSNSHPSQGSPVARQQLKLAILGDSDSHSYQDRITFPPGTPARGGKYRRTSLQWSEVLGRLRGSYLDLGPWGDVGWHPRIGRLLSLVGESARTPSKEDYLHNFAISGARCEDLNGGRWRQSHHLADLILQDPTTWDNGLVVVRIGINSVGMEPELSRLALNPNEPEIISRIHACTQAIAESVSVVREANPSIRFVLVGIFNNAHWAKYLDHWNNATELQNIDRALDRFDHPLRAMAQADPTIDFLDERRLFADTIGGRDAQGRPAYRTLKIGSSLVLRNAAGDEPDHLTLADGHNGTLWNAFWTNHLLERLESRFGIPIPRLTVTEMTGLLGPAK